uniref:Capsid protein n=1 Tax=Chionoecetes opilio bacilliform virus TaxID=1825681 RepID=A0A1Q3DKV3_9VIRU|nr:capsid protein [Chionoecetes opilio bacilliform virus]
MTYGELIRNGEKNHLEWLNCSAIALGRSFNMTTFYAIDSMLKSSDALADMYTAFIKLLGTSPNTRIKVKSTLMDSIFNTRMKQVETIMGLLSPTAFVNQELPTNPKERAKYEMKALSVFRGINSGQLNINDTPGVVSFATSILRRTGGLSLYHMSIVDRLSCNGPDTRIKGAVSLEVGDWKKCDNSVFSKRSPRLLEYSVEQGLDLEKCVGPMARFVPNGTKNLYLSVDDDPSCKRLAYAERPEAPSEFLTMSAIGNLYGQTDVLLGVVHRIINEEKEQVSSINAYRKIMKKNRRKFTKTPFGADITQNTNYPLISGAIVHRARRIRNSVAFLMSSISRQHDISPTIQCNKTKVSVDTFPCLLETAAVLANSANSLRDIENRLQAAYAELTMFKEIEDRHMSETQFVVQATCVALSIYVNEVRIEDLLRRVVDTEINNLKISRRHVTESLKAVNGLHIRVLGMIHSVSSEIDDSKRKLCTEMKGEGTEQHFIEHPATGMMLKVDDETGFGTSTAYAERAVVTSIQHNQSRIMRSKLQAMRCEKYDVLDVFSMGDHDIKNMSSICERLARALVTHVQAAMPQTRVTDTTATIDAMDIDNNTTPLVKRIPFIPIIHENRYQTTNDDVTTSGGPTESQVAQSELAKQEANDLNCILAINTKHKFVSHNQAATVAIFNGSGVERSSPITPENERKNSSESYHNMSSITNHLPLSDPVLSELPAQSIPTGKKDMTSVQKLKQYASRISMDMKNTKEYKLLTEINNRVSAALSHLDILEQKSFFEGTELDPTVVTSISQAHTDKNAAVHNFRQLLQTLEAHTPDPSMATVSLPITSDTSSVKDPPLSQRDYFQQAYDTLHTAENNDTDLVEQEVNANKIMEQESTVRIPLLIASSDFSNVLRGAVDKISEYFQKITLLSDKIDVDAKDTLSSSLKAYQHLVSDDKDKLNSLLDEFPEMYKSEDDSIRTAITILENKCAEFDLQNQSSRKIIIETQHRLDMSSDNAELNDILNFNQSVTATNKFLNSLEKFASEQSGPVFIPESKNPNNPPQSYISTSESTINAINIGQEGVSVNYDNVLASFPRPEPKHNGDKILIPFIDLHTERIDSVNVMINIITDRIQKLKLRLKKSAEEAIALNNQRNDINNLYLSQSKSRHEEIQNNVDIASGAARAALVRDEGQTPLIMGLGLKVDQLLARVERVGGMLSETEQPEEIPIKTKTTTSTASVKTFSNPSSYSCFMKPMHEVFTRIGAYFSKYKKGPLNSTHGYSDSDSQLMSMLDLSSFVLAATSRSAGSSPPEDTPSSIIPGICELCAMVISNMHVGVHESPHSFNFEDKRSSERMTSMLNAAMTSGDNASVIHDILSMLEGNNGHVKSLSFIQRQKVACLTPVNTLIGSFSGNINPNTVLIPTSELFSCPGVDADKFRSVVNRNVDNKVADAPKTSASIVETLARTSPGAEKLFYPFKDQVRHFNSVSDAIIANMNSDASSQLNTTCDQGLVQVDEKTAMPIFVGRVDGTSKVSITRIGTGGIPEHNGESAPYVDMNAKFMVAPGSLLNAKKNAMLILNRLSDINNVRHFDTDVHVAGANSAWRIEEVVNAASAGTTNMANNRKMILLGSISAVATQKAAKHGDDPTAMLSTTSSIRNLVNDIFPSPLSSGTDAADAAFSTQLAYRYRLFKSSRGDDEENHSTMSPMTLLNGMRRYKDSLSNMYPSGSCETLKQSMANVPNRNNPLNHEYPVSTPLVDQLIAASPVNKLSVEAMTDSVVDMLSAVSSIVGRQRQHNIKPLPPAILSMASSGRPATSSSSRNYLIDAVSKISQDAFISNRGGYGESALSAFLSTSSSNHSQDLDSQNNAAKTILSSILNGTVELNKRLDRLGAGEGSAAREEYLTMRRNATTTILQLNEDELSYRINSIGNQLDNIQLRNALSDMKKSMSGSSSMPLSALLSRKDALTGHLSRTQDSALAAIDKFNTTPLLVRHMLLDTHKTPVPIAMEVRATLRHPKAITASALLSEASPLLTEIVLHNVRDAPSERGVDRFLTMAYLVKQAKRFDGVDPMFPAAITGATHLMLSSMESTHNNSHMLNNIKLHMNDTSSFLKNIERYEKMLDLYGDSYDMSHRQNCNCPFPLHHDFRPSVDEQLVCSFAYARPEVNTLEIAATPYQANKILNDKHYIMALSKVDTRITGAALLKKVSEWTEMRMNVSYNGVFEPSRRSLSNSGFTTAGVNLDVIVRPKNVKSVLGILECHRNHICTVDAKTTIASTAPSAFQYTDDNTTCIASELVQNALPHNRYIQKSTISAPILILSNVLVQSITELGKVINADLREILATSVPETILADTKNMLNTLSTISLEGSEDMEPGDNEIPSAPKLMANSLKQELYRNLTYNKVNVADVPFASSGNGPLAYDYLLSTEKSSSENIIEHSAATALASSPSSSSSLRNNLGMLIETVARQVNDTEFRNILRDMENRITHERKSCHSSDTPFSRAIYQEYNKLVAFLSVLRHNITPALMTGQLGEKVAIYLSLLSSKSRLENFLQYGLSNSSSVDLSHLKPLCGNSTKNIEDTFMYRNVNPVLIMALPENFTALLNKNNVILN